MKEKRDNKRLLTAITIIVLCFLMIFIMCSCNGKDKNGDEDVETQTLGVEVNDLTYGFVAAGNTNEAPDYSDVKMLTSLTIEKSYYMVIHFSIKSRNDNDGQQLVTSEIRLENCNILDGKFEDVSSGSTAELPFTDSNTGNSGKKATADFKIPDVKDGVVTKQIIVKLIPKTTSIDSSIKLTFSSSSAEIFGSGSDGLTKNLTINKIQLTAPEITYNEETLFLSWNHVNEHANYYKIIVNDEVIQDNNGNDVVINVNEFMAVGNEINKCLADLGISGVIRIKVQAWSNNANYLCSSYSNEITIRI